MTCSGISFTGITTGIPTTGIIHTPIIMIPGTTIPGIMMPGTDLTIMADTTTDMFLIIHATIRYTFRPAVAELMSSGLTAL